MPSVSVLMPIYRTDLNYLKEAMDSVLNQTYQDFEFLILNDSPDDKKLEEFVLSYKDSRIKYFKNKENMGITPSRNKLTSLAKGNYLMVMDHDDVSHPLRMEKQVSYLKNYPQVGVVGSFANYLVSKTTRKLPVESEAIKENLMFSCAVLHSGCMIRKDVLIKNNIKYEEEFSPAEDYALFTKLIGYCEFYNIPEILFYYRDHETNTTHLQKEKMDIATFKIYKSAQETYPNIWNNVIQKGKLKHRVFLFGVPIGVFYQKGKKVQNWFDGLYRANVQKNQKKVYKLFNIFPIVSFILVGRKTKIKLFDVFTVFVFKSKFFF